MLALHQRDRTETDMDTSGPNEADANSETFRSDCQTNHTLLSIMNTVC